MLGLLATDGTLSLQSLSERIGAPKSTTHMLYWKLVSDNSLVFAPEINIGELHKLEILNIVKRRTKRELVKAVMEEDIIAASYGEYIVHFSFANMPASEELGEALQSSHLLQYAGLSADGIVAYCIAKYADELDMFISKFCKEFDAYGIVLPWYLLELATMHHNNLRKSIHGSADLITRSAFTDSSRGFIATLKIDDADIAASSLLSKNDT